MPRSEVLIHCNAGDGYGMGHLMRSLALAQEATARGWRVNIAGDISEAARRTATQTVAEVPIHHVDQSRTHDYARLVATASVLHIDSYWNGPDVASDQILISNMQDGPYGVRRSDLAVDGNLGAETWFARPDLSTYRLIGIDAALIRRQVRCARTHERDHGARPRVLVVMGGTDPDALAARAAEAVATIETPLDVTVVAAAERHARIANAFVGTPHTLSVHVFLEDFPRVARQQDLIISAAGTSIWDFACMGVPMALVCAVDNQRRGYQAAIDAGLALPLGESPHEDLDVRIRELVPMITDDDWGARTAALLRESVDGLGAWRIVSAWEELTAERNSSPALPPRTLAFRRATAADATTLFRWRNDATTRAASRTSSAVSWDEHRAWLASSTSSADRQLYIVHDRESDIATVRWDRRSDTDWEVSITVAPTSRGRGLGRAVLAAGETALEADRPVRLVAAIHASNIASQRLFRSSGYLPQWPADDHGFETLAKWRLRSPTQLAVNEL